MAITLFPDGRIIHSSGVEVSSQKMVDQWRLNTSIAKSSGDLTSNWERNDTDFDKTLEKWGAGEGNYLVLPFIGPRSSRHLAGSIIDIGLNPLNYFLKDEDDIIRISPTMLYAVSARSGNMETIDNLRETSIDYYSSLKSIYYQSRSSGLNESLDEQVFDDFFESLEVENKND